MVEGSVERQGLGGYGACLALGRRLTGRPVAALSLMRRYIDLTGMIETKYEDLRMRKALIEDKDLTGYAPQRPIISISGPIQVGSIRPITIHKIEVRRVLQTSTEDFINALQNSIYLASQHSEVGNGGLH